MDLTHSKRELSALGNMALGESGKTPRGRPKPGRQIFERVEVGLLAMVERRYGTAIPLLSVYLVPNACVELECIFPLTFLFGRKKVMNHDG